jgi:hypothetical protein
MILIIILILLIVIVWLIYGNRYNNYVLDTIKYSKNWQWVNPIPSNNQPNIPYVFDILPNNILQVSFYDGKGFLKGFSVFQTKYTILDENTIRLEQYNTIKNYSNVTPTFPWMLKYIDSKHLSAQISGVTQMLEII